MSSLYVFVDESGNHTQSDCYIVAGCWCLSDVTDLDRVLQPTKNKISDNVVFDGTGPSPGQEIKGETMADTTLNSSLAYLRKIADDDHTISSGRWPWEGCPVAFTLYDSESEIARKITEMYLGEGRSLTPVQLFGLASILSPIFRLDEQRAPSVDAYQVVLDADTWERPRGQLREIVRSLSWVPETEFVTRDSTRTPGIQLADVAAYTRRKRVRDGDCYQGMRFLNELLL